MLVTVSTPQNSEFCDQKCCSGHPQERGGQQPWKRDEMTAAACAKKPSGRGSKQKTSTVTPSRSANVTSNKEESSEDPGPWGRRPDHIPGDLGLFTAALLQQLAQGYDAVAFSKPFLSVPTPLRSVFCLFKYSFVQDKAYLPMVWVSISGSVVLN